jgi:putative exosortase-associated protein (TIGR04073 family)
MKRFSLVMVFAAMALAPFAQADLTLPKKDNFYDKLGRGLADIVLAPSHLLDSTYDLTNEYGPTVGYTKGLVQGTSRMIMDIFIGVAEVVSSPFPTGPLRSAAYDSQVIERYPPADLIENWY